MEISGPPGMPKERVTLGIAKSFVKSGNKVIILGMTFSPISNLLLTQCQSDCQNMAPDSLLRDVFDGKLTYYRSLDPH